MPSQANLTRYRKRYAAGLPSTAIVRRQIGVKNGAGGNTSVPDETETGLKAEAIKRRPSLLAMEGERPISVADYDILLGDEADGRDPATFDVKRGYEIAIEGVVYRVEGTDKGETDAICLTVDAVKVS